MARSSACFHRKHVVYLGQVQPQLLKYGWSDDFAARVKKHRADFGRFDVLAVYETANNIEVEKQLKQTLEIKQMKYSEKINGKMQTELIRLTDQVSTDTCRTLLEQHVKSYPHPALAARDAELELLRLDKQLSIEKEKNAQHERQHQKDMEQMRLAHTQRMMEA